MVSVANISHDFGRAGYQDRPAFSVAPRLGLADNMMALEISAAFDLEALEGASIRLEVHHHFRGQHATLQLYWDVLQRTLEDQQQTTPVMDFLLNRWLELEWSLFSATVSRAKRIIALSMI